MPWVSTLGREVGSGKVTCCAFSGTCSTDHGDALAGFEFEIDVGQNVRAIGTVANGGVSKFDLAGGWPRCWDEVRRGVDICALFGRWVVVCFLGFELDVLPDSVELSSDQSMMLKEVLTSHCVVEQKGLRG